MDVEVGEVGWCRLGSQRESQPVGEAIWVEQRAEAVAEPWISSGLAFLEEEVHLDGASQTPMNVCGACHATSSNPPSKPPTHSAID